MKRGFSLVEVMISVGIAVIASVIALQGLHMALTTMKHVASMQSRTALLDEFVGRLEREAASSDAVWVSQDASGNSLHFSFLDGSGSSRHWMYRFASSMQRIDVASNVATTVTEAKGLTGFTATSMPASAIPSTANTLTALFSLLPAPIDTQYTVDAAGVAGNAVCVVTLQAGKETRVVHLLSGPSAESFGIEEGVFWHSIVWRAATTRRFLFGLAQKTDYHIMAEVAYTTDNWATSRVWCQYDVYGPLDVSDPRAQPTYYDASESASAVFTTCRKQTGQNAVPSAVLAPSLRTTE